MSFDDFSPKDRQVAQLPTEPAFFNSADDEASLVERVFVV